MSLSFSDKSRHLVTVVDFQSLSRVWFCNSTNHSTPGFPVLHNLSELAKTHVYWVSDAIQPSHPLLYSSPSALNLSQHQGLFQRVNSLHQVVKVLALQLQHQSFQWIFRVDFLYNRLVGSPCHPRDSQDLLQHHNSQVSILHCSVLFMVQFSHLHMTTGKTIDLPTKPLLAKWCCLCFLICCPGHRFKLLAPAGH